MPHSDALSAGHSRRTNDELGLESVRAFVDNLRGAMRGQSEAEITTQAGLASRTLRRILDYELLPTIDVVARLEEVLNADLWPKGRETSSTRPGQDEASGPGS